MTEHTPQSKDPATMDYEQSRDELAAIVAQLEEGTASLDQSLTLWERGEALAKRCNEWLDSAQARLDAVAPPAPAGEKAESNLRQEQASSANSQRHESADPPW
jgi:exodeoxyribonuclease VII small subunit